MANLKASYLAAGLVPRKSSNGSKTNILILTPYRSHTPPAHYKIAAALHHPTAHKRTRARGSWLLLTPHDAGRLIGGAVIQ